MTYRAFVAAIDRLVSGDLTPFGAPTVDESVAARVRAEQIAPLVRFTSVMMLANMFNAGALNLAMRNAPTHGGAALWAIVMALASIIVLVRAKLGGKLVKPKAISARALRHAVIYAFLLGSLWGVMPLAFFEEGGQEARLIIMVLGSGMLSAGALALGSVPFAAIAFVAPIFLGYAIAILRSTDPGYTLVALLMVLYTFVLIRAAVVHALQLVRRVLAQVEAERMASNDGLTNLPNRIQFQQHLEMAVARLERYGEGFAVFYLDLDEFKSINDRLGHAAGDALLIQTAERLRTCTRTIDTVARLGGDEFAMIQVGVSKIEDACILGERLIEAFSTPFILDDSKIPTTISVGISIAPADGTAADVLVKNADIALYLSKRSGRGTFRMFEPVDDAYARDRRVLEQDLRTAMPNDEFHLAFQPLVDLMADRVTGFEALLRWRHPSRGLVPPSTFIPLAERSGLILPIGNWVLEHACAAAADWPSHVRVAVNFSPPQFRGNDLPAIIETVLAKTKLDPARLEIEITESLLMKNSENVFVILRDLKAIGVKIALDDFGTGYSSLDYLRQFPFDRIKIDRSFTADIVERRECASIVRSLIGLASDLDIAITAEGVETLEQLAFLDTNRCREVQGYLIGMPQAGTEARRLASTGAATRELIRQAA